MSVIMNHVISSAAAGKKRFLYNQRLLDKEKRDREEKERKESADNT